MTAAGSKGPDLMTALDESAQFVELMTGIRQRFIEAGWSADAAEQMVLEMLRRSS